MTLTAMVKQDPPLADIAAPGDLFSSDSAQSTNMQIAVAHKAGELYGDGLTLHAGSCMLYRRLSGTLGLILDADGD